MSTNGVSGPEPASTVTATLAIPRDAIRVIAPPPDTISQRNVEAATGIPARVYLDSIRAPGFPLRVTRLGKLRIVNRAAFVAWLDQGAFGAAGIELPPNGTDEAGEDDPSGSVEHVLDKIGFQCLPELPDRRTRAGRRR